MKKKMTPEQFVYWLQDFFETSDIKLSSKEQIEVIRDSLKAVSDGVEVFKVIKSYDDYFSTYGPFDVVLREDGTGFTRATVSEDEVDFDGIIVGR